MDGRAKIELILELKNRVKTGITEARRHLNDNVRTMKTRLDEFKNKWVGHWNEMKNSIPGVGMAMRLLTNPLALAAGGMALLGRKMKQASEEARRFSLIWREVSMLNLDKSSGQMNNLRFMVQETAYNKGFDHTQTARGFYDVQSLTGKFGKEVDLIVQKQGEFARLMQADFNNWISASGKALSNYGFGYERLDDFNRSAFAAIQVGASTFDELAKVMPVFAGSAAAARQDFETANKLFAVFTLRTKNADISATMLRSLFTDLTKPATIKAFEDIGINMYNANGSFRQADELLLELNDKFKQMKDDKAIINLQNQFAGSEGLIQYISTATDKTEGLRTAFDTFNNTEYGLNKALKIARDDVNYINETLKNKTKAILAEIGQDFSPIEIELRLAWNATLDWFRRQYTSYDTLLKQHYNSQEEYMLRKYPGLLNAASLDDSQFSALMKQVRDEMQFQRNKADRLEGYANTSPFMRMVSGKHSDNYYGYHYAIASHSALMKYSNQAMKDRAANPFSASNDTYVPDYSPGSDSTAGSDLVNRITGSAQPVRNVTVNIDSFVKGGINTQHTNLQQMDESQLEAWFKNMFLRVMANMDASYQ